MANWCKDIPTVIAFTGKSWCGYCQVIEPELKKLQQMDGVSIHFMQFDIERGVRDELHQSFGVQSYPLLIVYCPKVDQYFVVTSRKAVDIEHFARDKVGKLTTLSECTNYKMWVVYPKRTLIDHKGKCGTLLIKQKNT